MEIIDWVIKVLATFMVIFGVSLFIFVLVRDNFLKK